MLGRPYDGVIVAVAFGFGEAPLTKALLIHLQLKTHGRTQKHRAENHHPSSKDFGNLSKRGAKTHDSRGCFQASAQ
jgi:hypothetical protein